MSDCKRHFNFFVKKVEIHFNIILILITMYATFLVVQCGFIRFFNKIPRLLNLQQIF